MKQKTVVIGGGAAGLMAAGMAAKRGHDVVVLEKNTRPARKVMITGKGRCNVTNRTDLTGLMNAVARNPKFLYSAFSAFSAEDTIRFFEELGVPLKVERGNRVFPCSDKSVDIVDALCSFVNKLGAKVVVAEAKELIISDFQVGGVKTADGRIFAADSVIIATGGLSYPKTGSTGAGYDFARFAGHKITKTSPSLIPIVVHEGWCSHCEGLGLRNVTLSLLEEGRKKPVYSELGEMLFTGFGVSGPLVLSASAHIKPDKNYVLSIDLKPGLDEQKLDARILRDFSAGINKDFCNSLSELLPNRLIPVVIRLSGIEPNCKVNQITKQQRSQLVSVIKNLKLTVTGLRPIDEAVITRGGVSVSEIVPSTMESKLCKGLFFAGEVLDVDAYTGGFNLQIAFSTGYLAGNNC